MLSMGYTVIENVENRVGNRVVRRKIIKTDDHQYPSGYRYALHHGYTDGGGTILRYDNESETVGRHERHTRTEVTEIEFPGMMELRDRFLTKIETQP
jgi:hypothetical protein